MLEWEELVKPLWQQSYVRMIEQVMGTSYMFPSNEDAVNRFGLFLKKIEGSTILMAICKGG
ncbi:hypothetical protein MTR_7g010860 [Medicago truncatula]|uniref:Uncharacterized protein n=1 Tax=Medicago truncatula TaxID=3880 RepID=G7L1Z4_MEDTR|nr:hypothetical protein MTR_7g010860 [Medicago truncatula]